MIWDVRLPISAGLRATLEIGSWLVCMTLALITLFQRDPIREPPR